MIGDAFPDDPNESVDTDADGVGDNADNCVDTANEDQTDSDANGEVMLVMPCQKHTRPWDSLKKRGPMVSVIRSSRSSGPQLELVDTMMALTERPGEAAAIKSELQFFITGDGADATPHNFTTKGGDGHSVHVCRY